MAADGMQVQDEVGPTKSMLADTTSMSKPKPKLSHTKLNLPGISDEFIEKMVGIVLKSKSNGKRLPPSEIVAIIQCDKAYPANLKLEQLNICTQSVLKPIIDGADSSQQSHSEGGNNLKK